MARLETRRYDGKLDSFLHKNLPRDDYERVCASEPCVVVSPEEKRVHKHVILGHRCLFFADFPPRTIKVAVQLKDIQSIRMFDDLPAFLSGKEQEETVHIQVHYQPSRAAAKEKSLLGTLGEKSPSLLKRVVGKKTDDSRKGSSPLLFRATSSQQPLVNHLQEDLHGHVSGSSLLSLENFGRSQSVQSFLPLKKPQHRSRSLSPTCCEELRNMTAASISGHPLHRSPPAASSHTSRGEGFAAESISPHLPNGISNHFGQVSSPSLVQKGALRKHSALSQKQNKKSINSPRLKKVAKAGLTASLDAISSTSSPDFSDFMRATAPRDASSLTIHQGSSSSLELYSSALSLDSSIPRPLNSSSLTLASLSGTTSSSEGGTPMEKAVMDLYVLKQSTDFYHQLYTTWRDSNIGHTLTQNGVHTPSSSSLPYDRCSQHYCSLKQELLSAKSLQSAAELAQELCTACQRYFLIKKMFWEDCELFEFCVEQLRSNLSPKGKKIGSTREDEIEYSIIVMDLLYQMLRESHVFSKRLILLTRNSGQSLLALVTSVLQLPPLLKLESEVGSFDEELTEKGCGILFELIRIAQQARWPLAVKSTVCASWLMEALAAVSGTKDFCSRVVTYVSSTLASGGDHSDPPEPRRQVTLHHAALILHTFVQNSSLVQIFRTHFTEEFRYYISISHAKQTLPESSPLSRCTLELLQSAKSKILQ